MSKENSNSDYKEAIDMATNAAVKISNDFFSDFLKKNKAKIDSVVPKNPSISKDDEWRNENFWDNKEKDD